MALPDPHGDLAYRGDRLRPLHRAFGAGSGSAQGWAQPEPDRPVDPGTKIELWSPRYLPDVHTRLFLYKRIASAPDDAALTFLQEEMVYFFGPLPLDGPVKRADLGPKGLYASIG